MTPTDRPDALREALVAVLRDIRVRGEAKALSGQHIHMTDDDLADLILSDDRIRAATPAPEAESLDVEALARAMCLANGDTPEEAEKFYEREVEEATRIAAEYARLSKTEGAE